jgi:hypothetical protein
MAATKSAPANATRIDARAAANAAAQYFQQLYPKVSSFGFEEVELSEDEKYWLITLSFEVEANPTAGFALRLGPPKTKFKVFKVNVRTGEVVSMKIREIE